MSWESIEFGQLAGFRNGLNYTSKNKGFGCKILGVSDFGDKFYPDFDSLAEINPSGVAKEADYLMPNDIVFVRSNGNSSLVGRSLFIPANSPRLLFSGFCIRARVVSAKLNSLFAAYYFKSQSFRSAISSSAGGANIQNLNQEALSKTRVPIPPLPVQEKIADILSAYDDLIENNLQRIRLLEELAQRTYEEWFVKFRVKGEGLPIDPETGLPEGWSVKKIGEFVRTSSGGTPSRKREADYFFGGRIPWIKSKELTNSIIVDSEEKITPLAIRQSSAKLFPAKTVLLAMYGNTIGETAYLALEAATNQACCAFCFDGRDHLSYFIHRYLISSKDQILRYRMGAAQENISQEIIKSLQIIVPVEDLLLTFGENLKPIYDLIENLIRQNRLLKEARDILLPRLMNGEIEV